MTHSLPSRRSSDLFGVKRLFFLGVIILMAGSVFCAISESLAQLTAARLLQGIGAAMLSPQTLVVATRALGEARRGFAIGIWGARSDEHTSALQSLMRISSDVFCLKKKKKHK